MIPAPGREKIGETRQSVLSALPFSVHLPKTHSSRVPDAVQRVFAVRRRAGTHTWHVWVPALRHFAPRRVRDTR